MLRHHEVMGNSVRRSSGRLHNLLRKVLRLRLSYDWGRLRHHEVMGNSVRRSSERLHNLLRKVLRLRLSHDLYRLRQLMRRHESIVFKERGRDGRTHGRIGDEVQSRILCRVKGHAEPRVVAIGYMGQSDHGPLELYNMSNAV